MADNVGDFDNAFSGNNDGGGMIPDPPRRSPGRPPGSKTKNAAYYAENGITPPYTGNARAERQEVIDESKPLQDDVGMMLPLFNNPLKTAVMSLRIIRIEPNEGYIGTMENPHANETDIQERWGGGTYRIQAIGDHGGVIRSNTVKVAGDPIFQSSALKAQWERMHGVRKTEQAPQQSAYNFPQAAPGGGGIDIKEMFMMMAEKENMRIEGESRLAERQRLMQIEADDRRRKDDFERDQRRKADEDERDRRQQQQRRDDIERDRENTRQTMAIIQASHSQSMQFMQAQLQMQQAKPSGEGGLLEAIKTIAVIKETFASGEGGGGNPDAEETVMQSLIKNGPAWLNAAGTAITGVVGEIKNGPNNNPQNTQQPQSILNNLPIEIQNKTEALVLKLMEKGLDPEAELNKVLDTVLVAADKLPTGGSTQTVPAQPQRTVPQNKPVKDRPVQSSGQIPHKTPAATPEPAKQTDIAPQVQSTSETPQLATVIPIKKPKNKLIVAAPQNGTVTIKFAPRGVN